MNGRSVRRGVARLSLILALVSVFVLAASAVTGAEAKQHRKAHRGKGHKVTLRITTGSQAALLSSNLLSVEVRGKGKVALSVVQGQKTGLAGPTTVKARRKPTTAGLPLTKEGRDALGACGPQEVTVKGGYVRHRHGKRKRRTALSTVTLAPAGTQCKLHLDVANPDRCDPIDAANCLAPYPNDYFTIPDSSTGTGRRLNINPASTPKNLNGLPAFSPEFNRNDGFSPNNVIVTRVPGIETPAAFKANHLVPQEDIGQYDDAGQRVLLIDAATGQRVPIWAEVDMIPGTPNPHDGGQVRGTVNDRLLMIHPAVQLDYGHRYLVALRSLTNAGGVPLDPNPVFKAYRDSVETDNAAVEDRRPNMEDILSRLSGAGVARSSLYLAWDFTVASSDNLTKRLLAMRNDAFGQLGDTDLDNDQAEGSSPPVSITDSTDFLLCSSDGTSECELNGDSYPGYSGTGPHTGDVYTGTDQSHYAFRKVTGTITVPCYMNAPGSQYNPSDPNTPCATGSRLHYAAGADVPSQNGSATWQAPFTCILPRTATDAPTGATGVPAIVFGHGLLGDHRTVEQLSLFPSVLSGAACGTNWIGLSAVDSITGTPYPGGDLTFLLNMLVIKKDLSLFSALPDRSQQGYINTLLLGRAMAAPGGFASHTEFKIGATPAFSIDPNNVSDDLSYYGVSLGGIFGAATTSVAPDWQRAVISVPGVGFSTLLTRSTQFSEFLPQVFDDYPDGLSREIGISMLQLVWDRGEPSAYLPHLTDDPLPNTPPHQVMIHEAFGDHQVTNIQTETMARSLDAAVRTPVVDPARIDDIPYVFTDNAPVPFYTPSQSLLTNDDLNDPGGYTGSSAVLYTFDTGPVRTESGLIVGTNPNYDWDIAPVDEGGNPNDGLDPHEPSATSPAAQEVAIPFLESGGYYDSCVTPAPSGIPPFAPPYAGMPVPCSAPPVHSLGQGK